MQDSVSRLFEYQKRHGISATLKRLFFWCKRVLTGNGMVLFRCDLQGWKREEASSTAAVVAERKTCVAEVSPYDLEKIIDSWNPNIAERLIAERFKRGASLWLAKAGDEIAGYGWTLNGGTMEAHYFPLERDDVHLFDFFVFPKFRGQRINRLLVISILNELAAGKKSRAYIEAAEWNTPQLHSLSRTPFQKFGVARKPLLFGKTIIETSVTSR